MKTKTYIVVGVVCFMLGVLLYWLAGQPAASEASPNATNWDTYLALLKNIPHWGLELTIEIITGILIYPLARKIWGSTIKKHDEEYHPEDVHK